MVFLSLNVCILVANVYESVNNNSPLNEEQKQLVPLLFVSIASLLICGLRFLDEWYEQLAAYHEVRDRRGRQASQKESVYFPGRYPKEAHHSYLGELPGEHERWDSSDCGRGPDGDLSDCFFRSLSHCRSDTTDTWDSAVAFKTPGDFPGRHGND